MEIIEEFKNKENVEILLQKMKKTWSGKNQNKLIEI